MPTQNSGLPKLPSPGCAFSQCAAPNTVTNMETAATIGQ
ncbi:hypothetical protein QFZ41_002403 [Luteibacter sp. W1I16]